MYSILDENNNEESTNKGHNSFTDFNEFRDTLFHQNILRHKIREIKTKNDNTGTYESNERSSSCFNDKRHILRNGIDTLPYRHKDISLTEKQ